MTNPRIGGVHPALRYAGHRAQRLHAQHTSTGAALAAFRNPLKTKPLPAVHCGPRLAHNLCLFG
jgi:hypothetical protein